MRHGPAAPLSPVLLSVPHAGRDYPPALCAALRVPPAALVVLEDRHADTLALAAHGDEILLIAQRARAWIDLNRAEQERDPVIDDGVSLATLPMASPKLRSGLGLVPRRAGKAGDIWSRRLSADEVMARIHADHRPWHDALALALAAVHARFGIAVLLDLHSMPPLGRHQPRLVFGDRFGQTAAARFTTQLESIARTHGLAAAINQPYAGGHILGRHGDPRKGIHAIQIEFDRTLYLDPNLMTPGEGFHQTAILLRAMIDGIASEAIRGQGDG